MDKEHATFCRKPGGKRPPGRPTISWENKIIWNLKEVSYEGDWEALVQET